MFRFNSIKPVAVIEKIIHLNRHIRRDLRWLP